jgi:histidinol phosphatase-like enzyme (inositol monophosphatase family)
MPSRTPPQGFTASVPGSADISEQDLRAALAVATRACDRAREEILPRFRNVAVETKGDGSPVTEADRRAEQAIREVITEAFPSDAILGEEFGATSGKSSGDATEASGSGQRRWVIDPIDGTIAFARGIPLFTTLVALLVDDEPVMGMIDLPAVDDRIGGYRGGGVWRGTERVEVSSTEGLGDALVSHGDLFCFDLAGLRPLHERMSREIGKLRGYTDAFGHLLVLSGAVDAMVDCDLNPWDAAATRVLAAEAGGVCWQREREQGRKIDLIFGNADVVGRIGAFLSE